jgi:hypothetical protein
MGTRKPGPPVSGSLADFLFDDDFWFHHDLKNDFTKFYELDLKRIIIFIIALSPVMIYVSFK